MHAVQVLPVLPDFTAMGHRYAALQFDEDPAHDVDAFARLPEPQRRNAVARYSLYWEQPSPLVPTALLGANENNEGFDHTASAFLRALSLIMLLLMRSLLRTHPHMRHEDVRQPHPL